MENVSQQIPPVDGQLPVKTGNNFNFFKTLAYGFVIASIGVSIAVGGYLLGANKTKTPPAAQISVSPTPTSDPTLNWKTYTNTFTNYQIKYPVQWEAIDKTGALQSSGFYITFSDPLGEDKNSLALFSGKTTARGLEGLKKLSEENILVVDIEAKKYTYIPTLSSEQTSRTIIVDFEKNATHYSLQFDISDGKLNLIDQILSTFKFTQLAPTPTPTPTIPAYQVTGGNQFNIYTNNVYSLSFNFPKSLFIYNSQSSSENASFLEKQGDVNAVRMGVEVFKNPNNLTLEQVEAKENLKVRYDQTFDLEKTTISGREALLVAGNKSMRELCNFDDDQKRRIVLAALVKGSNFVLIFTTNNTCDTFRTDWFNTVTSSINLK